MTSAVSSDTTRSTHFRLGSLSLRICFLTIASKARSGVNSPVLRGARGARLGLVAEVEKERNGQRNKEKWKERERQRRERERGNKKKRSLFS